jgi:hypothetical protein
MKDAWPRPSGRFPRFKSEPNAGHESWVCAAGAEIAFFQLAIRKPLFRRLTSCCFGRSLGLPISRPARAYYYKLKGQVTSPSGEAGRLGLGPAMPALSPTGWFGVQIAPFSLEHQGSTGSFRKGRWVPDGAGPRASDPHSPFFVAESPRSPLPQRERAKPPPPCKRGRHHQQSHSRCAVSAPRPTRRRSRSLVRGHRACRRSGRRSV